MKTRRHSFVNIATTGVLAMILLCVGLFWARWFLCVVRADLLPSSAREVMTYPTRNLLRAGEGADPNLLAPSRVTANMGEGDLLLVGLGAFPYLQARMPGGQTPPGTVDHVYRWDAGRDGGAIYFDPVLGLIVNKGTERLRRDDGTTAIREFVYYAGPEGLAQTPDQKLGRFVSPIADAFRVEPQTVFDRSLRRFFAIRWRAGDEGVRKGPELPDDGKYQPVQIGLLDKNYVRIDKPPALSSQPESWMMDYLDRVLVLDASGRIDWLDLETLEVGGAAGHLPMPETFLGSRRSVARPEDVSAYAVAPFRRAGSDARGTAVATVSREGLALQLSYFDANGVQIAGDQSVMPRYEEGGGRGGRIGWTPSEKAVYSHAGLTIAKLLLENLHPPVLVLLSYFLGPEFEATAGYRSLFLLPDSFVAMVARSGRDVTRWERFFWAVGFMLPGLVLWALLAVRLDRDGIRVGTPKYARRTWVYATLILGLPAYITYRLTRPKATLVTCANCGLGRRPDFDKCHRCGSPWSVPELTPPAWRVLGEPESAEVSSPTPAEEMDPR